jgi:CHAT domain-containing protein
MAQAERLQGDLSAASEAAAQALERIEALRVEPSSTDLRSLFFATKQEYFRFYVDLLMERHEQQPRGGYAAAALETDERGRARSLLDELARGEAQRGWHQESATPPVTQPLRLAEVQRLLSAGDTVLLQYSLGAKRSFLWVISADALIVQQLPAREEIEKQVRRAYDRLTTDERSLARSATREALRALSATLLEPVAAQLREGKRLAIVADGVLYRIPFGALPHPGTTGECLLDLHEIAVLPSSSSLASLRDRKRAPEQSFAVVADPVFDATDPRLSGKLSPPDSRSRSAGPASFARLPYSAVEAGAILRVAPKDSFFASGFAANRSLLANPRIASASILHFATHARVDAEHPERSGLALSTFDAHGDRHAGFVYAYEIQQLDLSADLVVLSACATALGQEIAGEGAMSLSRAFFIAGARSALVTLWPVDDAATAALMEEFYRALLRERQSPTAALRTAQQAIRARPQWQDPYFWAGFELQGDWS